MGENDRLPAVWRLWEFDRDAKESQVELDRAVRSAMSDPPTSDDQQHVVTLITAIHNFWTRDPLMDPARAAMAALNAKDNASPLAYVNDEARRSERHAAAIWFAGFATDTANYCLAMASANERIVELERSQAAEAPLE